MNHLVFVYGTLKTNEPNHLVISSASSEGQSQLVGQGRTVENFPLVIASRYNIPYLLDAPGKGHRIRGEVCYPGLSRPRGRILNRPNKNIVAKGLNIF